MIQYKKLINHILNTGIESEDRTGTGSIKVFGYQSRYDLSKGFPIVTTKKTYWKGVVGELIWFLDGNTNTKYLKNNNIKIWDEWADSEGNLGPIYGSQWRDWMGTDQIARAISLAKNDPNSRRNIVSAWNVSDLDKMALVPCHAFFQFAVINGKLSCQLYQRSADVFLGVPFNIASYALLTHLIADRAGLEVGEFVHTLGDAHIYLNHVDQCKLLLSREVKPLPTLKIDGVVTEDLKGLDINIFKLVGYDPHPAIKGEVSV